MKNMTELLRNYPAELPMTTIELYIIGTRTRLFRTVSKNNRKGLLAVRTAFGGKCLNISVCFVVFNCTNKQKWNRNSGKKSNEVGIIRVARKDLQRELILHLLLYTFVFTFRPKRKILALQNLKS